MTHEHEALIGLDGLIKCKTCGEILACAEQELGKVSSARMANRLLSELAIKGQYTAKSFEDGFISFSKDNNGITEEITCRKKSDRVYIIYKKLQSKT